jgi:hypothetical protein
MKKRKIKLSDFNLMLVVGTLFAFIAMGLWLKTGIIMWGQK